MTGGGRWGSWIHWRAASLEREVASQAERLVGLHQDSRSASCARYLLLLSDRPQSSARHTTFGTPSWRFTEASVVSCSAGWIGLNWYRPLHIPWAASMPRVGPVGAVFGFLVRGCGWSQPVSALHRPGAANAGSCQFRGGSLQYSVRGCGSVSSLSALHTTRHRW